MFRVVALVFLVACGSTDKAPPPPKPGPTGPVAPTVGPSVDPGSFDRACIAATDCVVVKRAGCDPCACANDAIASKDMAHFDEVVAKLACEPPDLSVRCSPCQLYAATCANNACVATPRF
ncbi:hypothetical protein BH11MYX3_BH11MYX3_48950 [soil metagenome]